MSICELQKPIIIPGPCAIESREHVIFTAEMALARGLEIGRLTIEKPRTRPGWKGVGEEGIPWLIEAAEMGLTPGTEVMLPERAEEVINAMSKIRGRKRLYLWLGARNQNDEIQKAVGSIIKGEDWIILGIKNQPWSDENHWEGIIEHVLNGGADKSQLLLIHRGFAPSLNGFRNVPDFAMAMRIRRSSGLPMLVDPSHIGGNTENVLKIARIAMEYREDSSKFDGLQIEVHPDPKKAKTDANQQLTWGQFDRLMDDLKIRNHLTVAP